MFYVTDGAIGEVVRNLITTIKTSIHAGFVIRSQLTLLNKEPWTNSNREKNIQKNIGSRIK